MLALGGLLIAPLAYVYSQLAAAMPRSGGEYVFLRSRRLPGADQGPILRRLHGGVRCLARGDAVRRAAALSGVSIRPPSSGDRHRIGDAGVAAGVKGIEARGMTMEILCSQAGSDISPNSTTCCRAAGASPSIFTWVNRWLKNNVPALIHLGQPKSVPHGVHNVPMYRGSITPPHPPVRSRWFAFTQVNGVCDFLVAFGRA